MKNINWPATITKMIWQAFCLCLTIGDFYVGFAEANDGNTLAGAFMMLLGTWLASVTFEAGNPIIRNEEPETTTINEDREPDIDTDMPGHFEEVDDTNSMTIINESFEEDK